MTPSAAIRDVLAFYAEAGVDAAIGETPNDYLNAQPATAAPAPSVRPRDSGDPAQPAQQAAPDSRLRGNERAREPALFASAETARAQPAVPPNAEAAVMSAREAARAAATLDELRAILEAFEGCALKATASRLCFADGNPQSRVMLIGEAPGREEDLAGLPFVGRSGQLLDRMLAAIGLDRTKVYIANIVPWRPPGNRTPTPVETQICLPFIQRQIELANPDLLVTIGQPSTGALLQVQGITKNRGRFFPYHTGTREIRAMPMLHPAYLLRTPIAKRLAWRDMLAIRKALA